MDLKGVGLDRIISPAFLAVHESVGMKAHTHYWLKGGRGSGKSSYVSLEIIKGMMVDENANGVMLRKIGAYLKDSVYTQLIWAIEVLGAAHDWKLKLSPLELIYEPTGGRLLFRGADQPDKIKSTKFQKGYCKYIWFEEADQFHGMEEIRKINQSLMRGGDQFAVFYTYNPPPSQRSWINQETSVYRKDRLIHSSDYREMPRKWLGEQFYIEAEHLKKIKPQVYEQEYLGVATGTGGEVFSNLRVRDIGADEIKGFETIYRGLDFGYAADPLHYCECCYDRRKRRLYIFYEIHRAGMKLMALGKELLLRQQGGIPVTADSAEPRSIAELKEMGVRITGAKKGPDSIYYGVKFLQDLDEIIIDPRRCPNTAREFMAYELERDKNGNFISEFPDRDNHSIDAVRYAVERETKRKQAKVMDIRKYGIW